MTGPFIFIGTYRIKDDRLEYYKKICVELVDLIEVNEPRMIAFNIFINEAESRTAVHQVHPDAASMEFHMKVVAEHMANAFDYLETQSVQVFGEVSEELLDAVRQYTEPGVPIYVLPLHAEGFVRTSVR